MRTVYIALLSAFLVSHLDAQDVWTLQQCIDHAREHNLTLRQAQANVRAGVVAEKQAKSTRLPNLNASATLGEQFGRTIDPTTNQFNNSGIAFNSFGLNANIPLFNGGLIHHSIRRATADRRASEADAENAAQTLYLQIAQAYLTVLLSTEQQEAAQRRLTLTEKQMDNTRKLVEAGSLPQVETLLMDAQISRDEQGAVAATNNLDLAYLNLKQLLQLEPDYNMVVDRPVIDIPKEADPDNMGFADVYNTAEATQPSVRAAQHRIAGAQEGIKVAKAAYWPSLNGFANLRTNYSSQFLQPEFTGNLVVGPTQNILVNGQLVEINTLQPEFTLSKIPYFQQLDDNFGQGFGVGMTVPIYQNGQTRLNVERARLNVLSAELQSNQTRQQLKNDVQSALASGKAGKRLLEAAEKSYRAAQLAYQNTEKRHSIGAANSLELNTAKTNMDNAENDLLVARYDYLFRLKIIDFYLGKPITIN
jgi:outer membrane protein